MHTTKVFLSGVDGFKGYEDKLITSTEWRLFSIHGSYVKFAEKWLNQAHKLEHLKNVTVLLDSGAFTAWSKGEEMPLSEVQHNYRRMFKHVAPHCRAMWAINLDKIPGEKGRSATHDELIDAVRVSDEHYKILFDEFGDAVMPVFHQDESIERLHECCEQNPARICVSPRNDVAEAHRRPWAARVHMELHRHPGVWTHGLAATGVDMMTTIPWGSVDSSTHIQVASYGGVLMPYRGKMKVIAVSQESQAQRFYDKHINSMPAEAQADLATYIETCGTTLDEVKTEPGARALVCSFTLQRVAEQKRVLPPQDTLFIF